MFLLNGSRIKALEDTVYMLQEEVSFQKSIVLCQGKQIDDLEDRLQDESTRIDTLKDELYLNNYDRRT